MLVTIFLCSLLTVAKATTGTPLDLTINYNNSTKQLVFRCLITGNIHGSVVRMTLGRDVDQLVKEDLLATWQNEIVETKALRVTVPTTKEEYLQATLDHVTCADALKYRCTFLINSDTNRGVYLTNITKQFVFEAEPTTPVLEVQPTKSHYFVGENINLTCLANIGQEANQFVWERRENRDSEFSPIQVSDNSTTQGQTLTKTSYCNLKASSWLLYQLTATDTSREWRCRLRQSHHEAKFYFTNFTVLESSPYATSGKKASPPVITKDPVPGAVKEEERMLDSSMVVLFAIIPISTIALSVAVVTFLNRRRGKEIPPLVVVDGGQHPLQNNYSSVTSRELPLVPQRDNTHSNLSRDHTPPKLPMTGDQRPISSIYVSMSAIPGSFDSSQGLLDRSSEVEKSSNMNVDDKSEVNAEHTNDKLYMNTDRTHKLERSASTDRIHDQLEKSASTDRMNNLYLNAVRLEKKEEKNCIYNGYANVNMDVRDKIAHKKPTV